MIINGHEVTKQSIELYSPEAEDIISSMPNVYVRWGLTMLFSVVVVFIGLSWLIKYPDIVTADIIISTQPAPVNLVATNSGKLILYKKNNADVKKGDLIASLQCNVEYGELSNLENSLGNVSLSREGLLMVLRGNKSLGVLQPYLNSFITALQEVVSFHEHDLFRKQSEQIKKQISSFKALNLNLTNQLALHIREVQISHQQYQTDSLLFSQQVLSSMDHKKSESIYLNEQRSLLNTQTLLLNNELQIEALEKNLIEIETQYDAKQSELDLSYYNNLNELKAQIQNWRENYLFISPIAGKVSYLGFLEDDTFIESGKSVFVILPNSEKIIAKAELPLNGAGKVNIGQRANLHLDNYPYEQFGMLQGEVLSISQIPNKENYQVLISLPNGMNSTHNKSLPFKPEMKGKTDIITSDLRLLERILFQFRIVFQ
jgi:multidrug resistance efflux pump